MFQRPEAFLLLFLFILLLLFRKKVSLGFPNLKGLKAKVPQASWTKRNLIKVLSALTFALFVLALANPLYTVEKSREVKETRLIVLVKDLSGSMSSDISGNYYTSSSKRKYEIALDAGKKFVDLRLEDAESSDYLALIAFADYAKLASPFTDDPNIIKKKLDDISPGTQYHKDMGIGTCTEASEAIWLCINLFLNYLPKDERPSVGELMSMKESLLGPDDGEIWLPPSLQGKDFGTGKVIIMMSDGEFYIQDTVYEYHYVSSHPNIVRAIRLMRKLGIRGYFLLTDTGINERIKQAITMASDAKDLETAGQIFELKADMSNIEQVYQKIHELEKTKLVLEGYEQTKGTSRFFTLLGILSLLCLAFLAYSRFFRKLEN